jgi:hypothetical protein
VFALLESKWRLSSGSGHWDRWKAFTFTPVIIYRAKSNLQADAGVCFVGVEVGAGSGGSAVVLAIGTDGKLSGW